jgi:hypothetical protein
MPVEENGSETEEVEGPEKYSPSYFDLELHFSSWNQKKFTQYLVD